MANAFCRRRSDVQIASMRFHALMDEEMQKRIQDDPITDPRGGRALGFWGWTDRRDAATACRLAIEKNWAGHEAFFISDDETALAIPTVEAIAAVYPGVELRKALPGFASALDNAKAKRILGWEHTADWVR
jgi:nucleoside-diphosphate-sugar epimerase